MIYYQVTIDTDDISDNEVYNFKDFENADIFLADNGFTLSYDEGDLKRYNNTNGSVATLEEMDFEFEDES